MGAIAFLKSLKRAIWKTNLGKALVCTKIQVKNTYITKSLSF